MMAHGEFPESRLNVRTIEFANLGEAAKPTVTLSGALHLSGGALYYIGSAGTSTELAAA